MFRNLSAGRRMLYCCVICGVCVSGITLLLFSAGVVGGLIEGMLKANSSGTYDNAFDGVGIMLCIYLAVPSAAFVYWGLSIIFRLRESDNYENSFPDGYIQPVHQEPKIKELPPISALEVVIFLLIASMLLVYLLNSLLYKLT